MKRHVKVILAVLISALFLLMALASSSNGNTTDGKSVDNSKSVGDVATASETASLTEEPAQTEVVAATVEPVKAITVKEQELLNKGGVKITLKSMDSDGLFGPELKILIENGSKNNITVQTRNSSINGVMINAMFSSDVVSGKKANDQITFSSSDLEMAGITTIKDIELSFIVLKTDSLDTILETGPITISTTADADFVQKYDDSGFVAVDKDNIRIIVKKLNDTTSIWGADLYVYVENNSKNNVTIQVRNVSLNGFMVDPLFSCDVLAGKKAYDSITFLESDLKDNNITEFKSLELSFLAFKAENIDTIFDSGVVKVAFEN